MQVQIRDHLDSPWRDIDWLHPDGVLYSNVIMGFEKYRIAPVAHDERHAA